MFRLDNLTPLTKARKRRGRGGSRGGTSGRGNKGQKARTGHHKTPVRFEGGQMPLSRRLPKRGFNNTRFVDEIAIVNLADLERLFDHGQEVTKEILFAKGFLTGDKKVGLKVLGKGTLSKQLKVVADSASKGAIAAIEQNKGTVLLTKGI